MALGRGVDLLEAPDEPDEARHERNRIGAGEPDGREPPDVGGAAGRDTLNPRDTEHHRAAAERGGESDVVARHGAQSLDKVAVEAGHEVGQPARRQPVRLGHQDVDADGRGPRRGDALHQLRQQRARPRPLPVAGQACVVDVDDDGGRRDALARHPILVGVETRQPQELRGPRVSDEQNGEQPDQHEEPERPATPPADQADPEPIRPVSGHALTYPCPTDADRAGPQRAISRPS